MRLSFTSIILLPFYRLFDFRSQGLKTAAWYANYGLQMTHESSKWIQVSNIIYLWDSHTALVIKNVTENYFIFQLDKSVKTDSWKNINCGTDSFSNYGVDCRR